MNHQMKLNESPFERIKSGKKIIEIRLLDEKRKELKINDTIEFSKLPELKEKIKVKIIDLTIYNSFKEIIDNNNINNFGYPKEYDPQKLLREIYNIYTPEQEKEYKVLGIKIKLIKA